MRIVACIVHECHESHFLLQSNLRSCVGPTRVGVKVQVTQFKSLPSLYSAETRVTKMYYWTYMCTLVPDEVAHCHFARAAGFDSRSRRYEFRDSIPPAAKSLMRSKSSKQPTRVGCPVMFSVAKYGIFWKRNTCATWHCYGQNILF